MSRTALCLLLGMGGVLTACAGGRPAHDPLLEIRVPTAVTLRSAPVAGLGPVLTDGGGQTLYMFPPDAGGKVSCTGACAGTWAPFVIAPGHTPQITGGVHKADLGTLSDPNTGGRIVTYNGFPLYRYAGDVGPGTAHGQGLFLNGGPWYAVDPSGQPVTSDPASGA